MRVTPQQDAGYGICWDNTQMNPHPKHQGKGKGGDFLLWALSQSSNVAPEGPVKWNSLRANQVHPAQPR